MRSFHRAALAVALTLTVAAAPVAAQDATPAADQASETAWPTADALRRDLQAIGFSFRIDRSSGDWLGWAPRAGPLEGHAITLSSDTASPTWARLAFETLETDLLGGDIDSALTAMREVAASTPLPAVAIDRAFRFIVDDLLVEVPVLQASCYATRTQGGDIVIRLDTETGAASVLLADSASGHPDAISDDECGPIGPRTAEREAEASSSAARSERLTVTATGGGGFEPAEATFDGPRVTLVLTFVNEDDVARSMTFDAPLEAATGSIEPGGSTLIIVSRLEVGDHAFGDAAGEGIVRIVEPSADDEDEA